MECGPEGSSDCIGVIAEETLPLGVQSGLFLCTCRFATRCLLACPSANLRGNLLAQVVHCTANVQGRWLAGCEFRQHVSDEAPEKLRLGLGKDVES